MTYDATGIRKFGAHAGAVGGKRKVSDKRLRKLADVICGMSIQAAGRGADDEYRALVDAWSAIDAVLALVEAPSAPAPALPVMLDAAPGPPLPEYNPPGAAGPAGD